MATKGNGLLRKKPTHQLLFDHAECLEQLLFDIHLSCTAIWLWEIHTFTFQVFWKPLIYAKSLMSTKQFSIENSSGLSLPISAQDWSDSESDVTWPPLKCCPTRSRVLQQSDRMSCGDVKAEWHRPTVSRPQEPHRTPCEGRREKISEIVKQQSSIKTTGISNIIWSKSTP